MNSHFSKNIIIAFILGGILSSVVIYTTPLQYTPFFEPTIRDIDPVDFHDKWIQDPEKYIFLDVRSEKSYADLHAVGSLNLPLHKLYDDRYVLPKKDKEIILICSGGRASGVAYSYLEHFGFTNISRIKGGIEEWALNELPTEASE